MHSILSAASFIGLYGISYGVVLFTISVGLVVTMGLMRIINMAHGVFAAFGGYLAVTLMGRLAIPYLIAVPLAVCVIAISSVAVERLFYARLYAASEFDQMLMTIGLMFVGIATLNLIYGPNILPAQLPDFLLGNIKIAGRDFELYRLFIIVIGAALIVAQWLVFDRTSFGARLRAAVDNPTMAQASEIDVRRLFSLAFAIGCGLAALGGAIGYGILPLEPLYPFKYLTLVLIVVVMSGSGNIMAAAVLAILIGVVDTAGRYLFPSIGAFLVYFVLIGILLLRDRHSVHIPTNTAPPAPRLDLMRRHPLRPAEPLFWLLALAVYFQFPSYLSIATAVVIMMLFTVSLDLIVGIAGVLTLGHAVFFGIGAYTSGLVAVAGWHEAISGALLGGFAAAAIAAVLAPIIVRFSGLPQIMLTLALGVVFYEAANKATWLTGGDDGLRGIELSPLFGLFRWSVFGQTGYLYSLAWLFVLFFAVRRLITSPFGVALQGIRENSRRMTLIGASVTGHLWRAYVISGFIAGVAGALSAQTTRFVSLDFLSLGTSVDGLVMLVLGGIGRLYGGPIGAAVYMLVHRLAAEWNPFYWMFMIGGLLLFVVSFAKGGLLGMFDTAIARLTRSVGGA